ncbi:uncharacterized protein LOC105184065 [Harpegnathos saltator]|uniref:uncharacterized protein LOC105184065 n=1 Tax=Harpegnathos saltator TaxID=610380 RepID=UPI00058BA922|nr:uncharacterized protein LOC105184065 [Harpegnathos saltator]XP_025157453.1 uncharacterized protein LOC105184065 [Harpegnathos saltator]XP_025157454.1 uncharacterized protein LOC105184065 [Harpegnathos saltator]
MDSLERLMSAGSHHPTLATATRSQNAFVQANLCSVIGRKGRHLTGTFCLNGDTMEGIIQCLVFLKAFSVRIIGSGCGRPSAPDITYVPRNVSVVSVVRRCQSVITKAQLI